MAARHCIKRKNSKAIAVHHHEDLMLNQIRHHTDHIYQARLILVFHRSKQCTTCGTRYKSEHLVFLWYQLWVIRGSHHQQLCSPCTLHLEGNLPQQPAKMEQVFFHVFLKLLLASRGTSRLTLSPMCQEVLCQLLFPTFMREGKIMLKQSSFLMPLSSLHTWISTSFKGKKIVLRLVLPLMQNILVLAVSQAPWHIHLYRSVIQLKEKKLWAVSMQSQISPKDNSQSRCHLGLTLQFQPMVLSSESIILALFNKMIPLI